MFFTYKILECLLKYKILKHIVIVFINYIVLLIFCNEFFFKQYLYVYVNFINDF